MTASNEHDVRPIGDCEVLEGICMQTGGPVLDCVGECDRANFLAEQLAAAVERLMRDEGQSK